MEPLYDHKGSMPYYFLLLSLVHIVTKYAPSEL